MKKNKLYLLVILMMIFLRGCGQSNFPVEVVNQPDAIPSWAYNSGQKNNSYTCQYVTRTQVEAATNSSIGHLYALTGAFSGQPGKAVIIKGFTVQSVKTVTVQIRLGTPTGVIGSANIPEMDLALIASDRPVYIPCNWVMRNIKSVFINCLNFVNPIAAAPGDTATWITITPDCYNITDDFNWDAKKRIEWVGTSITNGTGPTSTGTMYHTLFKDTLRKLGVSVRHELNGISGATTATHVPFFTQGAYDHLSDGRPPDVLIIECAVNDASAATPTATYVARLKYDAERFLTNPENKKIKVIILGATPLENTTAYNNSVTLDAAASALVTTLRTTYGNDRVYFISLSGAFDRTLTTMYIGTDTPGARIHPSDLGSQNIQNAFGVWLGTADGQAFLIAMKK